MANEPPAGDADWPELDVRLGYDAPPLVPAGNYDATATHAKVRPSYGGALRLHIDFTIQGGDCDGKLVSFICTLPRRLDGRWRGVAPSSRFFRAWCVASGGPPRRRDRMGLDVFKHRLFRVRVRDVDRDRSGQPLPAAARYSIVDMLLERLA
ncbi:MAG: hypothetical protein DMD80_13900 [Candidatus Rokuibacteriota bacterium]|nr:MAG: hypothetical protein DMD80_13900 [Candidatus Rokubacteria bacterium]